MTDPRAVEATAPVRVDLAGGTLDLWPLGLLHPGATTVAVAIDLRVRVRVTPTGSDGPTRLVSRDLGTVREIPGADAPVERGPLELVERIVRHARGAKGLEVVVTSPVTAGSGLGTSSALGIAVAAAVFAARGLRVGRARLVPLVRDLEAVVLGIPTGTQDHHLALHGGLGALEQRPGDARFRRLGRRKLDGLAARLVPFDSGQARSSAPSNWDMFRRRIEGEPAAITALDRVRDAGIAAAAALEREDWPGLGRAMRADLEARATWSPLVLTPRLERILAAASEAGALGAKVCGAGGGGWGAVLVEPGDRDAVVDALRDAGGRPADIGPARHGLRISRRSAR
ncbi:MAG: hypothetical protein Kow0062_18170 [Acidobacteriota bacterium]